MNHSWSRVCGRTCDSFRYFWELWYFFVCLLVGALCGWGYSCRPSACAVHVEAPRHAWVITLRMPVQKKTDAINTRHGSISHGEDALSNDDADSVAEQPSSVSPEMLAAIKLAIKDAVDTQLANIDKALRQLVQINERIDGVEHAMQALYWLTYTWKRCNYRYPRARCLFSLQVPSSSDI